MTTAKQDAEAGAAMGGFVASAIGLVSDRMQELVIADMPGILQAVAQAKDPQELRIGVETSLRQAALSVVVSLQMQSSGTQKAAVTDLIHQLECLREGVE